MSKTVRPDDLAMEITAALSEYSDDIAADIKKAVKQVAKEAVTELSETSPKKTGEYRSGWKTRVEFESDNDIRVSVYQSKKPQLTHLLEFGHAKVGGGRVEAKAHIYPAEQNAARKLEDKAKVVIKR